MIGTPLEQGSPAANRPLQERIYRDHLLLSPFAPGSEVYARNFPQRNRVMAAVSDATVIVEASDTSGALHQAKECATLGRWLFICRSVTQDPRLPVKPARRSQVEAMSAILWAGSGPTGASTRKKTWRSVTGGRPSRR